MGLPLVIRFSEERFKVIGFDIDEKKCKSLNAVEIDPLLAKELQKLDLKNTRIINQDFLELDLDQF